jgi:hypothetical protein
MSPTRLFLMRADLFGIPVQAFHRLIGGHATMQVKVAAVVPMADERGDQMDLAETLLQIISDARSPGKYLRLDGQSRRRRSLC